MASFPSVRCSIVPPYLLRALSEHSDEAVRELARRSLEHDHALRQRRTGHTPRSASTPERAGRQGMQGPRTDAGTGPQRTIGDARGFETTPGTPVRREGQGPVGDAAADEAYDGFGKTWELFDRVYGRDSLDGKGLALLGTVHYGKDYDNAFWDGSQMVFGDGDGTVFTRFTIAVDVIGHELTHGVTEYTAGLQYQGQSGALNESLSDVFGSLVKQRALGQSADHADWLIGEGLFTPSVHGVALRSMKAPGTAYDDPQLGRDPQPATMDGYVDTTDDNGGVHLNSGIPNHAFYLAATAIGGHAWEGAGHVWFDVLTGGRLPSTCDFATFAAATVSAAQARYGDGSAQAEAVQHAWDTVGVAARPSTASTPDSSGSAPDSRGSADDSAAPAPDSPGGDETGGMESGSATAAEFRLRRTGGFAGQRQERRVVIDELSDDDARDWRSLLQGDRLQSLVEPVREVPDSFVYHLAFPPEADEVDLPEHGIPRTVRELFSRTLGT
ncbi:protealysin inhibitor emfourin [Pedococcus sp. 5OH_020]|uniref:protealysin inhibitor emfourin n=1 Tax=Pedococcus sp. 5OH_020 TaxID=2989814 RepID=UPI0022E9FC8D|nr:protealysin inhibitor emfourin [Pedococcus sp. 5OH_020]